MVELPNDEVKDHVPTLVWLTLMLGTNKTGAQHFLQEPNQIRSHFCTSYEIYCRRIVSKKES
jgi:hypothetical protein